MAKAKHAESEITTYDSSERPLVFVPKRTTRDKNRPDAKQQQKRREVAALWQHCVNRHKARWSGEAVKRGIPHENSQGIVGWWFPEPWVTEFHRLPKLVRW